MKENVLKWLSLILKGLSVLTGLAAYNSMIPEKWMPIAAIVFAAASLLKDTVTRVGDLIDNGKEDGSFK